MLDASMTKTMATEGNFNIFIYYRFYSVVMLSLFSCKAKTVTKTHDEHSVIMDVKCSDKLQQSKQLFDSVRE